MTPDPSPPTPFAGPYAPRSPSEAEHAFYSELAHMAADRSAHALAVGDMRMGTAHRYLIAAHMAALIEGGGDDAAAGFLNELAGDFGLREG